MSVRSYHGNLDTGKVFWEMEVGDVIQVSPEDFPKYANARAYFQRKMKERKGLDVKVSSRCVKKDGEILHHVFRRIK